MTDFDDGAPVRPRRQLAATVSVRLTPDEAAAVRRAAGRMGMSQSAFLRAAALARVNSLTSGSWTEATGFAVLTLVSDPPEAAA